MKLLKVLLSLTLCLSVITINSSHIKAEQLPEAYNIKDDEDGLLGTYLKTHYANMSWSFSLSYAMDINIRKKNLAELNNNGLSPQHLTYYSQRFVSDPLGGTADDSRTRCLYGMQNLETNLEQVMSALMTWSAGPTHQNEMTYIDDRDNSIEDSYGKRIVTPYQAITFDSEDIKDIQEFIYKNGAVVTEFNYSSAGMDSYNSEYEAQYRNEYETPDQVITIIGWDDNFSKEKFNEAMQPEKDGAWYCRDTRNNAAEYKWISYYDETLRNIWGIELTAKDKYDNNYQYDGPSDNDVQLSYNNTNMTQANVFTIKANTGKKELVKAVHFDTNQDNIKYTIQLYKNPILDNPASGTSLLTQPMTGVLKHNGKYTIDLDENVVLNDGDRFSVVVRFESLDNKQVNIPIEMNSSAKEGQSYYTNDSIYGWNKLVNNGNVRIKAFTTNIDEELEEIKVNDIVVAEDEIVLKEGEEKQLDVTVLPENATNKTLTYESSNNDVVSVNNGVLTAKKPGTAIITIESLSNQDIKESIEVTVTKKEVLPNSIVLQTSSIELEEDEDYTINAIVLPNDANNKSLKYSTDNDCVTVNNEGVIKALKAGSANISIETVNGIKETLSVTVKQKVIPVTSISIQATQKEVLVLDKVQLSAIVLPENATDKTVTWISTDETIATVENGIVTTLKAGRIAIIAKAGGKEAVYEITVKEAEKPVEPEPEKKTLPFTDVSDKQWYYDYINESYQLGLMTGATDTLFKPSANMNRGMMAIVFHRMEGSLVVEYSKVFPDVSKNEYYTTSVLWAKQAGVINGYTDGTFKPLKNITREELATMIYNFAKYKGLDVKSDYNIEYFNDYAKITPYARVTIAWVVENGIMSGKDNGARLDPLGFATRAEACKMLLNAYKLVK